MGFQFCYSGSNPRSEGTFLVLILSSLSFMYLIIFFLRSCWRRALRVLSHSLSPSNHRKFLMVTKLFNTESTRKLISVDKTLVQELDYTCKILKISCGRCTFVKFDIHFLWLPLDFFLELLQMIYYIFSP